MKNKNIYPDWTLIDWDGITELGYKCWRKTFGKGHVSVGVGEFTTVIFSFGPDSENSYSSTRWRKDGMLTELEAMKRIDETGKC